MKKNVLCVMMLLVVVLMLGIVGYNDTHYTTEGYVVSVNNDNHNVLIKDNNGHLWLINDDSYEVGQQVTMKMCSNDTGTIEDDVVTDVKIAAT